MKYCSKCGAELADEAIVCVKCGCPVTSSYELEKKQKKQKQKSLFSTAAILNIIAFAISMLFYSMLFFTAKNPAEEVDADFTITVESASTGYYGLTLEQLTGILSVVWPVLSITILVLGFIAIKKNSKLCTYIYLCVSYLLLFALFLINPRMIDLVICGLGLFIFSPTILQTIAGINIIKAINKHVE